MEFAVNILHILLVLVRIKDCLCQQYFRVKPHDTSVIAGRTAELHCHIGNRAGLVQWSKDGFLLGYDPEIPGYERYEMRVDHTKSAYTLFVHNARLDDEGEFQCQVGPGKNEKPIRSIARLTVLVPPRTLSINGLQNNSDLDVREAEKVVLECQAQSSKPATILKWYRKNIELMAEAAKTSVRREEERLYTTVSAITLYPKGEATGVPYSCEAFHPALESPIKHTIFVQVLYPPSPPEIEGFQESGSVQVGTTLTLTCISKGGKPPARLVWYKNGDILEAVYSSVGRRAMSKLSLVTSREDNNAIYVCAAVNPLTPKPLLKTVKLNVLFPPKKVFVDGPLEVHRGETVTVVCRTDASNPPAEVSWQIDGKPVRSSQTSTVMDEVGWYTTSKVITTISRQEDHIKVFTCHVKGVPRRDIFQTFNVTIIHPPGKPKLEGDTDVQGLRAGRRYQFTCLATSGYPPADIRWYKGTSEIPSNSSVKSTIVKSVVDIDIEASDNGIKLRCEVNNTALINPLFIEAQLKVFFLPTNISVTISPQQPREGDTVTLQCLVSSSNPASKIVWWKNGRLLPGHQISSDASLYGGWSSKSSLLLRSLTSQDDESAFTCEARNEALEESVRHQFNVRVRYAPTFIVHREIVELIEGQSGELNVSARAHPEVYRYVWRKGKIQLPRKFSDSFSMSRINFEDNTLYFNNISREDAGEYACTAENAEGSTSANFKINVLYPAFVTNITGQHEIVEGENTTLECSADGNPVTSNMITWRLKNTLRELPATTTEPGKSILSIANISRFNSGYIECLADNGITGPHIKSVHLSVMYRPYVLHNDLKTVVAVGERKSANLTCRAEGNPAVTFTWSYNGTTLTTGNLDSQKYGALVTKRKENEYWSTLSVKSIDWTDFGIYTCVAGNSLGHDFVTFTLSKTGKPECPEKFDGINVTHNSVILMWNPGFDGGLSQIFHIRYRDTRDVNYSSVEVPQNSTSFHVKGLKQGTVYEFAISAQNPLGESAFSSLLRIRTKNLPVMDSTVSHLDSDEDISFALPTWLLVLAVAGTFVVAINMFFCIMYVRKKQWCQSGVGAPGPELMAEGNELSLEKKTVKKKIPCGLEEDSPPFYLSGTTIDLPDDGLDLSSFQKTPSVRHVSHETCEDDHQSIDGRCDCGRRQWGNTLVCGSDSSGHHRTTEYEHTHCPDILKRDNCHCHVSVVPSQVFPQTEENFSSNIGGTMLSSSSEMAETCTYSASANPMHTTLSTFQTKSELPIRHSLLEVIGPKMETFINGDSEGS